MPPALFCAKKDIEMTKKTDTRASDAPKPEQVTGGFRAERAEESEVAETFCPAQRRHFRESPPQTARPPVTRAQATPAYRHSALSPSIAASLSAAVPLSAAVSGRNRNVENAPALPPPALPPKARALPRCQKSGQFLPGKAGAVVPVRAKPGASVWTADKRTTFLAELAATSNVTKSAKAARMTDSHVYAERRRNPGFRDAWTDALSEGYARLEFMMLERANEALSVKGKVSDERLATNKMHEYSNKLALNLLTAHRALVREARSGAVPSRHTPNRVAGSKARLIAKLDEMRSRSGG
jgi:hypothetical protein